MNTKQLISLGLVLIVVDRVLAELVRRSTTLIVREQTSTWYSPLPVAVALAGAIGIALVFFIWTSPQFGASKVRLGVLLACSGALSNMVSVVVHGAITDYIPTGFFVTNLADIAIITGLVLIGLSILETKKEPR